MKQTSAIILIVLSMNLYSMGSRRPAPTPEPTPQSKCDILDPGTISYDLKFIPNFYTTDERMNRVKYLAGVANLIMNSPEFKHRVLTVWYKGKAQFADTDDTNEMVYQKIRETAEVFDKCKNFTVELEYQWGSNSSKVLGWTTPSVKTIWFNYKNFDPREDSGIVGTICHEYMHKLGYDHSSAKSYSSVPYAVGTICAEMYADMKKNTTKK